MLDSRCRRATLGDTSDFLFSWNFEPTVVAGLALAMVLYAVGWMRLRRRAGDTADLPPWRAWCFAAALGAVALALLSPIDALSEVLLSMHMVEHLLLVEVAAPLLLLGAPLLPLLWALPRSAREGAGSLFVNRRALGHVFGALSYPLAAVTIYLAVLAIWHVPALYDAAQGRTAVHDMEHTIFLGSALLYWWPIIHPSGGRRRLGYAAAIPYLLAPLFEGSLIGALLTFAERPLYATYEQASRVWGISVLQDQQLAGLIMWVPGGMVYLLPIFVALALMFREEEGRATRAEQPDLVVEELSRG